MSGRPTGREFEALVRDVVRAINDRDLAFFDELLDGGFEFRSMIGATEGRVYRGSTAMRDFFADADAAFSDLSWEALGVTEVSGPTAIVETRITGRGRGSGVPIDVTTAQVWTWGADKPTHAEVFMDLDSALAAARGAAKGE